jgi:beta-glucosidase
LIEGGFVMNSDIKNIILQMTLEEKAGLCSGLDFWHTKSVERLGIPSIMMTDDPIGIRKQEESSDLPRQKNSMFSCVNYTIFVYILHALR